MPQSLAALNRAAQTMDVTWVYDRIGAGGQVMRTLVPYTIRYTFAPEMRLLLTRAGFKMIELYGDYDFEPYVESSPRLFVVAALADRAQGTIQT